MNKLNTSVILESILTQPFYGYLYAQSTTNDYPTTQ